MAERPSNSERMHFSGVTQIKDLEHSCIALIRQIKDLDKDRCSGVTQIRDLEHSCIALIRQIRDLDKSVKKVHHYERCTEKCITPICCNTKFFHIDKYVKKSMHFYQKGKKIHTCLLKILNFMLQVKYNTNFGYSQEIYPPTLNI